MKINLLFEIDRKSFLTVQDKTNNDQFSPM